MHFVVKLLDNNRFLGVEIMSDNLKNVQAKYAVELRAAAIKHLRTSSMPVATGFRGQYIHALSTCFEEFLSPQSKDKAWGTYIELTALAEKYNYTVLVTCKNGQQDTTVCLYRGSDNAPTLHLDNWSNTHWGVHGRRSQETLGDGNCLYNAFAQARFLHNEIQEIISDQPLPAELQRDYDRELERIRALAPDEQQQIAKDYVFALGCAGEAGYIGHNLSEIICAQQKEIDSYNRSYNHP